MIRLFKKIRNYDKILSEKRELIERRNPILNTKKKNASGEFKNENFK